MAVIDIAGFVSDVKSHALDHGFHVHDERHFVETYSLRQLWEVDLHPEEACAGPLDLHLSLEVDPRTLLSFEDAVLALDDPDDEPQETFIVPFVFTWSFPPLGNPPDLLIFATEISALGGLVLPLDISAIDSFHQVTDAPERSISVVGKVDISLHHIYCGNIETICEVLDTARDVSLHLLERVPTWLT